MKRLIKYTFRAISLFLILGIVLTLYFLSYSPVAFQKSISITPIPQQEFIDIVNNEDLINDKLDIPAIIKGIPYNNGEMVYEVHPKKLYDKTVVSGNGNCSNLSFGLSYYLMNNKHKSQIIHFLPIDGFLMGGGHTVVNTSYLYQNNRYNGIIDVIEGGIPFQNKKPLEAVDLMADKSNINFHFVPLNDRKDSVSEYYGKDFLNTSVIGVIPQSEIDDYFSFMSTMYVPIYSKNKKIEKILFNGLSVIFGYFPNIYVTESDESKLFENNYEIKVLAFILIFSLRIIVLLGLLLGLLFFIKTFRRLFYPFKTT